MSGQFSEAMRDNAAYGLGLALLAILLYITLTIRVQIRRGCRHWTLS